MSIENNFDKMPDDELLALARQAASEIYSRGLDLPRSLGEIASQGGEVTRKYKGREEEVDPFLEPASLAAKVYARQRDPSGKPRWMEPFAKVDMFGKPTVFSGRFDPFDRRT